MRIVFLLTAGLERPAGHRYFSIARELVKAGCSVRILALHPDFRNCARRRFVRDGVEIWYVGQMHARKRGSVPVRFTTLELLRVVTTSTFAMMWALLRSPADYYHLGKPQPINGLAAVVVIGLLRRRRFYVDCDDDEVESNRLTTWWQRAVFACWQWVLPRLAAGVTVNTRYMEARMRRSGVTPIAYVPNGVDPDRFRAPPAEIVEALRRSMNLTGRRIVAYVGTLALQNHPVDLLVAAFAEVADDVSDAVLLLIGGGEDLPELRRQAQTLGIVDRVLFTGQLPRASVPAFLALADVSVDPVYDDSVARARSPLKLFESMALGVPVVTGDVGDRADWLARGGAGVVVAPGNTEELAEALKLLLTDRELRAKHAIGARQHVQSYSWPRLTAQWRNVYARGAGRRCRAVGTNTR